MKGVASASSGKPAVKSLKRLYERAKSVNSAYSLFDRLLTLAIFPISSILAWFITWWHWYWATLSWAGVAFAFLIAWITLSFGVYLVSLSARNFRGTFGSWFSNKNQAHQYLLEKSEIYPALYGKPPEYHAIPNKEIREATIWLEYSYYSRENGQWERRRRISLGDIRDVDVGEWSIIKRRIMNTYKNDVGKTFWRWGDATEQPTDPDYLYLIDHHYRGRVVLKVKGLPEEACYFYIFPINQETANQPFIVNYNTFDFAREWETEKGNTTGSPTNEA